MLILDCLLLILLSSIASGYPNKRANSCYRNATQPMRCTHFSQNTFLELELPYETIASPEYSSSLKFAGDKIISHSRRWLEVKRILPKCWPDLQVALASILTPQCDEDPSTGYASKIYQPSYDLCNDLVNRKNNCAFFRRHFNYTWLAMFNCSDSSLYKKDCTNNLGDLDGLGSSSMTDSGLCKYPLVPSDDSKLWFRDVGGCAMHCKSPIIDPQAQHRITSIIEKFALIGLMSTGLALLLYAVNKMEPSRMAKVTKQCTHCQLMVYLGWMTQFVYNQEIACGSGGAPSPELSRICIMTFFLTYPPSLASLLWCAYLAKLCFEKLAGIKKDDSKGQAEIDMNIYLFCYGVPLSLSIIVEQLGQVQGHGLYGICTVGQHQNTIAKIILLHVPSILGVLYANFFFIRTLCKLWPVKDKDQRLKRNFARIVILTSLSTIHLVSSIGRQIYELRDQLPLLDRVDDYLACSLNPKKIKEYDYLDYNEMLSRCTINTKPDSGIYFYYVELISTLSIGITIASWALCESNFRSLRRKLVDMFEDEKDLVRRYRRHVDSEFVADFEETHHDVIDIATSTQTPRAIDLEEVASLGSTSLNYSAGGTIQGQTRNQRRKQKIFQSSRKSRDVLNDMKQPCDYRQGADLPPTQPPQPPPGLETTILENMLMYMTQALPSTQQPEAATTATAPLTSVPPSLIGNQTFAQPRPSWTEKGKSSRYNFTHDLCEQKN